jgi:hypothetical protein
MQQLDKFNVAMENQKVNITLSILIEHCSINHSLDRAQHNGIANGSLIGARYMQHDVDARLSRHYGRGSSKML